MLELAKKFEVKEKTIVESVQKSIDQARQSIIYSESLRMKGNEFSKIVYDFINNLVKLKEQLLTFSKNEDKFQLNLLILKRS
ncbi:MAG TPA: hypothetical protein PLN45_01425 [Exilispira sp.]|nr:hypothetical protein [Exilispira sp.]